MNFRDDYLYLDPDDGKTYVYYDESGNFVMKYLEEKGDNRVEVPQAEYIPRAFPAAYLGPYFPQNGMIVDFRVKVYEYQVDLTATPPALVKRLYFENLTDINLAFPEIQKSILGYLKLQFQQEATKSDNIAIEYYKKSLMPEYAMKMDAKDVEYLKLYPTLVQRYNDTKTWIQNLTTADFNNENERPGIIKKMKDILTDNFFDI